MNTTECWICSGSTERSQRFDPAPFVECKACGFVFRPELDRESTRTIYEGGEYQTRRDYVDASLEPERLRNAEIRLEWIRQETSPEGSLLDVGASAGSFVLAASQAGFDARGIEPSPIFAAYGRDKLGVDVRDGRLEDLTGTDEFVDVITMWHVLEHIPHPVQALRIASSLLKPSGLLFVEVPNSSSIMARRLGREWPHLDPEVHVNQFTPATLARALDAAGFAEASIHTVSHIAYQTRMQRMLSSPHRLQLMQAGAPRLRHPEFHEFIRAVAR